MDLFKTKGCRRKFILSYFGQKPKFFWYNNCDNCCEKQLKDYTDKVYKVAITGIDMDLFIQMKIKVNLLNLDYIIIDLTE